MVGPPKSSNARIANSSVTLVLKDLPGEDGELVLISEGDVLLYTRPEG